MTGDAVYFFSFFGLEVWDEFTKMYEYGKRDTR